MPAKKAPAPKAAPSKKNTKTPATVDAPADIVSGFTLTTPSAFSLGALRKPGDAATNTGPITAPMPKGKPPKGAKLPIEQESDAEVADLEAAFYDAKTKDKARRELHQAADYYVNVVFATIDDAQKFVDACNVPVVANNCVDGYLVAKRLGLNIPFAYIEEPNVNVLDSWADIALPLSSPHHTTNAGSLLKYVPNTEPDDDIALPTPKPKAKPKPKNAAKPTKKK